MHTLSRPHARRQSGTKLSAQSLGHLRCAALLLWLGPLALVAQRDAETVRCRPRHFPL